MKITEGGKLERPNVCFLCETTPAAGSKVIDTERYFEGWPVNLQGRRYVCERCVHDMLVHFEFATFEQVRTAQREVLERDAIIRGIKLRLDALYGDLKTLTENPNVFSKQAPIERASLEVKGVPLESGIGSVSSPSDGGVGGHSEVEGVHSNSPA